jgi:dolichol-phosphate mannosyltransferase
MNRKWMNRIGLRPILFCSIVPAPSGTLLIAAKACGRETSSCQTGSAAAPIGGRVCRELCNPSGPNSDKQEVSDCAADDPEVSIIVPALNEAENLRALAARLGRAMEGRFYEVLIVDDGSNDGTSDVCEQLRADYPIRLLTRSNPSDGLSGAVLHGMNQAKGQLLVVMDADLQHPPEQVPDLLDPLIRAEADFVLGSRYVRGGATDHGWSFFRRANSHVATLLARPFAAGAHDPMSGFFALRRSTFESGKGLDPVGYKIALELMCKCKVRQVREVPIHFALREAGESKLNLKQQARYLDHLSRLYDYCFPRASTWAKFIIMTGAAWFVAFGLYVRLVARNASPVLAPTLAFAAAALTTGAFHYRALRRHGQASRRKRDWLDFAIVTFGEWVACTLTARWVSAHVVPMTALQFFGVVFGLVALARYALRLTFIRNLGGMRSSPAEIPTQDNPAPFREAA